MIILLILLFIPIWLFVFIFGVLYFIISLLIDFIKDIFTLKLVHLLGDILFLILIPFDIIYGFFATFAQTCFAFHKIAIKEWTVNEASQYLIIMQENPRNFK